MIAHFYALKRNVVIVNENEDKGFGNRLKIDLWWGGLKGNGGLLMIMAYLLQSSLEWYDAKVSIKMMVQNDNAAKDAQRNLYNVIKKLRTGAELDVIVANGRTFDTILHESSKNADLIFMGMAVPDENFESLLHNHAEAASRPTNGHFSASSRRNFLWGSTHATRCFP